MATGHDFDEGTGGYQSNLITTHLHHFPQEALDSGDVAIFGMKGSGKTHAARTLVERLIGAGRRVIILDPTGAWHGAATAADGGPGLPVVNFGAGADAHMRVGFDRGRITAEFLQKRALSAVIDLTTLGQLRFNLFAADFLEQMFALQQVSREPVWLVLDEVDRFAPQVARTTEQKHLLGITADIATRGRLAGIRLITITTRLAKLSKDVVSEVDSFVAMRMPGTQDRRAVSEWMDGRAGNGAEIKHSLSSLKTGEAWVATIHRPAPIRMSFPPITTRDTSATPAAPEP